MSARTLTPSYKSALRVWWAFSWRWGVWMVVGCVALGLFIGAWRALFGLSSKTILNITSWSTIPLVIWSQLEAFRRILALEFDGAGVRPPEKGKKS